MFFEILFKHISTSVSFPNQLRVWTGCGLWAAGCALWVVGLRLKAPAWREPTLFLAWGSRMDSSVQEPGGKHSCPAQRSTFFPGELGFFRVPALSAQVSRLVLASQPGGGGGKERLLCAGLGFWVQTGRSATRAVQCWESGPVATRRPLVTRSAPPGRCGQLPPSQVRLPPPGFLGATFAAARRRRRRWWRVSLECGVPKRPAERGVAIPGSPFFMDLVRGSRKVWKVKSLT